MNEFIISFLFIGTGIIGDVYIIFLHFFDPKKEIKKVEAEFIEEFNRFESDTDPFDVLKHMTTAEIIEKNKLFRKLRKKHKRL